MNAIEKKQELMTALASWRDWQAAGAPKHGYGKGESLMHDNYHNHIEDLGSNVFRFSIQVYDSPEGDTWWDGRFRTLNSGTDVEIIEERSDRR